jgi:hypothetical protein
LFDILGLPLIQAAVMSMGWIPQFVLQVLIVDGNHWDNGVLVAGHAAALGKTIF